MGKIITFYSYKGGVGRSMALANVAVLLSNWGFRTLMIDWDLEAPGLESFFKEYIDLQSVVNKPGILDFLVNSQEKKSKVMWQDLLVVVPVGKNKEPIHLIPAGKRDEQYFKRLRDFDVSRFYEEHQGGKIIERLRLELAEKYDFVLVDSRTGVTDVGGICTIQLPDILVMLSTPTEQGVKGVKFIADAARKGQQHLPVQRKRILTLPVPTRIDGNTEFKISQQWTERFAEEWGEYYDDWLPVAVTKKRFIEHIKLPYVPYFSYGEKLPVIEQGTDDKAGLGFAYENLAALIARGMEDAGQFVEDRDRYVEVFKLSNGNGTKAASTQTGLESLTEQPIKVLLSFSNKDDAAAQKLKSNLSLVSKKYLLQIWDSTMMLPGTLWNHEIVKNINESDVFIFLISHNSLAEYEIAQIEMRGAVERTTKKSSNQIVPTIIPIRLGPTRFKNPIDEFKALPRDGTTIYEAQSPEEKWREVLSDLEAVFAHVRAEKSLGK